MKKPRRAILLFFAAVAMTVFPPQGGVPVVFGDDHDRDPRYVAPFVPTPEEVVLRMLELAEIAPGDVLYDLGSGDGRIVILAAKKYGIKAVGFELDSVLVRESRQTIEREGLQDLVEIRKQDIMSVDLSPASVLTMFLYSAANLRLRPAILSQMRPGSRVVSHQFAMGGCAPAKTEHIKDSAGLTRTLYLWRIEAGGGR